jgi:hypothetical protein
MRIPFYYLAFILIAACVSSSPLPEITPESLSACMYKVHNRGTIPFEVLKDIVTELRATPLEVFEKNNSFDVYSSVQKELGPYTSLKNRAASMGAVMVVQGGFESSWGYKDGRDMNANNTKACTEEAGLYQTSGNMNTFSKESEAVLVPFQALHCKSTTCSEFKRCTKEPVKAFVHGHFMRAARITVRHWGPMVRKEINPWLRRDCASQIESLL